MSTLELGTNMPAASHEAWLDAVDAALRGKSLDSLVSTDLGGFTRQPLYTQEAMADDNVSGLPGFVPYTRGARAVNDKFLPWQIAQRLTPGRKGSDQKAVMTDLNGGVSAIMLDFSQQLPTLAQLDKLLNEVMLDIAPLSVNLAAHGMQAAELIISLREHRNLASDVVGFLNLDPLSAHVRYGAAIDLDMSRLIAISQAHQGLRLMTASGATWHDLGASVVQELAWGRGQYHRICAPV